MKNQMKPNKYLRLSAALALTAQLGMITQAGAAQPLVGTTRYQAKLFELIEADEPKYDADFAKRFAGMLAPYNKEHRNFRKRITSGAASDGSPVQSGGRSYVHYSICQAHQCDNTTMDVLFDPASKRMVAKVVDRCVSEWLGTPDAAEQVLLDTQYRENFPATAQGCGAGK